MSEPRSEPPVAHEAPPVPTEPAAHGRTASRALLQYSILRLGLFFVVVVALHLVGIGGIVALMISLLMTSLLGFFLLRKQRNTYAVALEARISARREAHQQLRSRLDPDAQP